MRPATRRSRRATSRAMRSADAAARRRASRCGSCATGCSSTARASLASRVVAVVVVLVCVDPHRPEHGRPRPGGTPRCAARTARGSSTWPAATGAAWKSSATEPHELARTRRARAGGGRRDRAALAAQDERPGRRAGDPHQHVAGPSRASASSIRRLRPRPRSASRSATSRRYSSMSPGRGVAVRRSALELLAALFEPALERDEVAVGVELREREVQQAVRVLARRSGARGWRPCCMSAGTTTRARTCGATRARRPARTARTGSRARRRSRPSSIPRRPARPVSWVYSPGVRNSCRSPVNFESFSITTERAGMLMPSESVSVANTTFTRPVGERLLHRLLHRWDDTRVVRGDPGLEAGEPARRSRARRGRRRRGASVCSSAMRRISRRSSASVRRTPSARHSSTAWSQPARLNTKHDRRQHPLVGEPLHDLDPPGGAQPAARRRPRAVAAGVEALEPASGFGRSSPSSPDERRAAGAAGPRPAPRPGRGGRARRAGAPR